MQEIPSFVDVGALETWLDEHDVPGAGQELRIDRVVGQGASNVILRLERGGQRWSLRRPSLAPIDAASAAKINARELRILQSLRGTDVRHPEAIAGSDDASIVGATFYVMSWVDGFTAMDPLPAPFDADPEARRELAWELIDNLAVLAQVDWRAAGLEGYGKPDAFLERQVDRWLGMLGGYRFRELAGLDEVADWLRLNTPAMSPAGILHGDYHFANVMYEHGRPARLAAIVDWEQSTIGDPLVDVGWLLSGWANPGEPPRVQSTFFAQRDGLPTRDELAERYAARTGRDLSAIDYYVVLALFKAACIFEGSYARFVEGASQDPLHQAMGQFVLDDIALAIETIAAART